MEFKIKTALNKNCILYVFAYLCLFYGNHIFLNVSDLKSLQGQKVMEMHLERCWIKTDKYKVD